MHADVLGYILEHHRLQGLHAMVEKFTLAFDYPLAYFINRLLPVLDILEQVDRRAKAVLDIIACLLRSLLILHHLPQLPVDPQLRQTVVVEANRIIVIHFLDIHFRFDITRLPRRIFAAGMRLQLPDDFQLLGHDLDTHTQFLGEFRQFVILQLVEMLADHLRRQSFTVTIVIQLEQQTLLQVARADTGRIELLHNSQRLLDSLHRPTTERGNLFESTVEKTIVIEIADDLFGSIAYLR